MKLTVRRCCWSVS